MRFWSSKPPAVASPQASRPNARSCPPRPTTTSCSGSLGARAARRQAPGWRRADAGDRDDDLLAGGRLGAARVPPPSFRAASHTSTHRRLIPPGRPGPPHRPSRARVRGQPAAPCESGPEGAHRPPTGHEPPPTLHASGRYPDTFLTRCGPRIDTTGLRVLAARLFEPSNYLRAILKSPAEVPRGGVNQAYRERWVLTRVRRASNELICAVDG